MVRTLAVLSLLVGCTHESADPISPPGPKPPISLPAGSGSSTVTPAAEPVTVELTAVTLADHCGNAMPDPPKPAGAKPAPRAKQRSEMAGDDNGRRRAEADVRCEQTSMQLSITVAANAPATTLAIKSAQLYDEKHASVGTLATRSPAKWSAAKSIYEPWDEKLVGGDTIQVTYLLAQPDWSKVPDRWNQTFTLEVTVAVAGADRTVTQVVTVQQATALPPNVRT